MLLLTMEDFLEQDAAGQMMGFGKLCPPGSCDGALLEKKGLCRRD